MAMHETQKGNRTRQMTNATHFSVRPAADSPKFKGIRQREREKDPMAICINIDTQTFNTCNSENSAYTHTELSRAIAQASFVDYVVSQRKYLSTLKNYLIHMSK